MSAPFIPQKTRDHRLDVFRGLALITIFIDHVPGNIYESGTIRNFGFSDAAEAFVLMSGIAVGLAYSRSFRAGQTGEGVQRVWRRSATLYVTHIVTSMLAMAIVATGVLYLGTAELIGPINFGKLIDEPFRALIGMPLLTHQLGYFNILPLYTVLLILSPIYLMIGIRSRLAMVAFAAAVWALAGTFRVNLPNYPNEGGWFFNPFAWQFIYVVGIAGGLAALDGRKFVAPRRWLYWLCVGFLIFACVWAYIGQGRWPGQGYLPAFLSSYDKGYLALPRLLHALALAYVLTNTAWIARMLKWRVFAPVELLGRNSLAVFATGSVIAIAFQVLRARYDTTALEDGALLAAGILVQYGIARLMMSAPAQKPKHAKAPAAILPETAPPANGPPEKGPAVNGPSADSPARRNREPA